MNSSERRNNTVRPSHGVLIRDLRRTLRSWFKKHGRDFPWRREERPFRILFAEMLLQRTHACQVERVYEDFFNSYKNPEGLAEAKGPRLKTILKPLGMRSRAPKIIDAANTIQKTYLGQIPASRQELLRLKGVGNYIAGIVLVFAYGKREWFIDGNVMRVMGRYLGLRIDSADYANPYLIECMKIYMNYSNPKLSAMAIIDFGAMVCIPAHPKCTICPLKYSCRTQYGKARALPIPSPKPKQGS
jgi:A/G-specific adenine glycosylase